MGYSWHYPLFVIRCGNGFAAVQVESDTDEPQFAVAVFTREALCDAFVDSVEIQGEAAQLNNDREFAALVTALSPPFTAIVFDAVVDDDRVESDWQVGIHDLVGQHLPLARSPWDYPLFVLREATGYTSISGAGQGAAALHAIGLFTRQELAEGFAEAAGLQAAVEALTDPKSLAALLVDLPDSVSAAAFNPIIEDDQPTAKHCLNIGDILRKHLPADRRGE
jgi:hypothetical protein